MHTSPRRLAGVGLLALATAIATLPVGGTGAVVPAQAAGPDYPAGYAGFHTYDEMAAEVAAVAASHPSIVGRFSIGRSYEGRELWAAKVSDNVTVDEPEPEILFDGLHHGNEPMALEMTLRILHWLVDGYGSDAEVTAMVDQRETWIVFAVNPDGQQYDFSSGQLRNWRRNRQPTPGTGAVGTDLNRNYPWNWGTSGGKTSTDPFSSNFRGTAPLSAPESRALADFVASRVVGGRQQIRVAASFHEFGRKVMWPYAYTTADVPADMTAQDRAAMAALGAELAALNGYQAVQASDLYLHAGTSADLLYGQWRIFAYTIELSAVDYPKDTQIAAETSRNRDAVLRLAEVAWCPLAVLGAAVREDRCGPFDDDFEAAQGWSVNPDGLDTAPAAGRFTTGDPAATTIGGVTIQPGTVPSGVRALVTGASAGSSAGSADLDGRTSVRSRAFSLYRAGGQRLTFRYVLAHDADAGPNDWFRAYVVTPDGSRSLVLERTGTAERVAGTWREASVSLDRWAGSQIRIEFEAVDGGPDSTVEVLVDDVRVTRPDGRWGRPGLGG